jgi:O-antigen ligase
MMTDPFELVWVAVLGGCVALAIGAAAYARPRPALMTSYFLLALAGTKFRLRSPTDALSGEIDWQIGLELALYASVGLIVVMSAVSAQMRRRSLAPAELLLVGFALLALTSTLWSIAPALTFARAFQMAIVCGVALMSVRLLGPADAVRSASTAFVAYVLGCAAIAAFLGQGIDPDKIFRFSWFAVHPLTAASSAALAALLVLGRNLFAEHRRPSWQRRMLSWMVLLSLSVVLILTNTRGPLLAFVAAAGLVMWKVLRSGLARGIVAATIVFVLMVALFGESVGTLIERAGGTNSFVVQRIFRGGDMESLRGLNGRVEVWEAALPLIADQPLFGYGYHGSRAFLYSKIPWASYAHSAYVQSLLDFGIVGALLIWGVFGSAFVTLVSRPFGAVTGKAWCDAALTGVAAYIVIVSVSSESFVATPGYEALLVFILVSVVGRCRSPVPQEFRRPQHYGASWPSAARRFRSSAAPSGSGPDR